MNRLTRLFSLILIIILSVTITSTVYAFSDSHKKAANDLMDTMNLNELLSQSIEAALQIELNNNPSLRPFEGTMRAFFNKYMSGESLREDYVQLYMESFSEAEIIDINTFYKTPTGQKALKATPALMAKGAALGQKRVQENISELQAMITEEAQRIQARQNQNK